MCPRGTVGYAASKRYCEFYDSMQAHNILISTDPRVHGLWNVLHLTIIALLCYDNIYCTFSNRTEVLMLPTN